MAVNSFKCSLKQHSINNINADFKEINATPKNCVIKNNVRNIPRYVQIVHPYDIS